jgi:hypothetical protein
MLLDLLAVDLFVGLPTLAMIANGLRNRERLQVDSQMPEPGALRGNRFRQRHFWEKPRHGPLAKPSDQA